MEKINLGLWKKEDFKEPLLTVQFKNNHEQVKEYLISDKLNCFWNQFLASPYNSEISLSEWNQDYRKEYQGPCIRTAKYIHVPKIIRPLSPSKINIEEYQELFILDEQNFQIQVSILSLGIPFSDTFDCKWLHIINDTTLNTYFKVDFKKFCLAKPIVQIDTEAEAKITVQFFKELLINMCEQEQKQEQKKTPKLKLLNGIKSNKLRNRKFGKHSANVFGAEIAMKVLMTNKIQNRLFTQETRPFSNEHLIQSSSLLTLLNISSILKILSSTSILDIKSLLTILQLEENFNLLQFQIILHRKNP